MDKNIEAFIKTHNLIVSGDVYGVTVLEKETCNLGHVHRETLDNLGGIVAESKTDALLYYLTDYIEYPITDFKNLESILGEEKTSFLKMKDLAG